MPHQYTPPIILTIATNITFLVCILVIKPVNNQSGCDKKLPQPDQPTIFKQTTLKSSLKLQYYLPA